MNRKHLAGALLMAAFALTTFCSRVHAAEPKPLTKDQAARLLGSMGYRDVAIGAVVQGYGAAHYGPAVGSQNVATVFAIGRQNEKTLRIQHVMLYDADIGWFVFDFDDSGNPDNYQPPTKLRLWTLQGYNEIRPKQPEGSLTDSSAAEKIIGLWKADALSLTYAKNGTFTLTGPRGSLSGTWKIERGTLIETYEAGALTPENVGFTERSVIVNLDNSVLVVRAKNKEGGEKESIWRR